MRRPNLQFAVLALLLFLFVQPSDARAVDIHWTAAASGFWDDTANWDLGRIPVDGDNVFIDPAGAGSITITYRTGTVGINALTCKQNLALTGGTLNLATASTITGTLFMTSG